MIAVCQSCGSKHCWSILSPEKYAFQTNDHIDSFLFLQPSCAIVLYLDVPLLLVKIRKLWKASLTNWNKKGSIWLAEAIWPCILVVTSSTATPGMSHFCNLVSHCIFWKILALLTPISKIVQQWHPWEDALSCPSHLDSLTTNSSLVCWFIWVIIPYWIVLVPFTSVPNLLLTLWEPH